MVLECAELTIRPGDGDDFAQTISRALAMFNGAPGYRSSRCMRGVENPDTFLLLIEWDAVEDHIAFTRAPAFDHFKAAIGPHIGGPSRMAHFAPLDEKR